jgi:hypothetical protein
VSSFTQTSEESIEVISDWAVETITEIADALIENGRPFDTVELSPEEQMEEYLEIRGNPNEWIKYINNMVEQILNRLQEGGVSPDKIASVHPLMIALSFAVQYSTDMEARLARP